MTKKKKKKSAKMRVGETRIIRTKRGTRKIRKGRNGKVRFVK